MTLGVQSLFPADDISLIIPPLSVHQGYLHSPLTDTGDYRKLTPIADPNQAGKSDSRKKEAVVESLREKNAAG